jgi:hypothetical protein
MRMLVGVSFQFLKRNKLHGDSNTLNCMGGKTLSSIKDVISHKVLKRQGPQIKDMLLGKVMHKFQHRFYCPECMM